MKAVVKISGKQYLVSEKESLLVDLLPEGTKELTLDALLVIDGDKLRVIRYKSKKRVHKETGHRQKYTKIEVTSIK